MPEIVAVRSWRGFAAGLEGDAASKSAAVFVAAKNLGESVVLAECTARAAHERELEPQHPVEAALGSGAVFPRDSVLDFAVASLRVALPSAISV